MSIGIYKKRYEQGNQDYLKVKLKPKKKKPKTKTPSDNYFNAIKNKKLGDFNEI